MLIALIVLVLIAVYALTTYNSFITLRNKCEEAFSTMDIFLKKRYDLIPNLVETVKGYAKHESETLEIVVQARNMAVKANDASSKIEAEKTLQSSLGRLFALGESYPELKANTNFVDLQNQLKDMESEIADARRYYNGVVKTYNIKCETIPSNIIANLCHFEKQPLFEITDQTQRENVKVSF